jgi:lipoprotein-anchoring transpeptidase ErfK/SrfK
MIWRAALAAVTVMTFVDVTPASAQFYGEQGFGRQPFWEPRSRSRQQWNNDYDDEWGNGDEDGYYRGQPIIRSGGARPAIAPKAPPKIAFQSNFVPNSIVIDSAGRALYFILSGTEAYQYPISVGREGFSWTGTEVISRKQEWPDWHPPKEMIARDPRLPDKMTGGVNNPLGALALYLGNTLYRVHGTNDASSIGRAASSGCFRMMNEHVLHLASIAPIGTQVTVIKSLAPSQNVARPRTPAAPPPVAQKPPPPAQDAPPPVAQNPPSEEHSASAPGDDEEEQRSARPDRRWEDDDEYPEYRNEDSEEFPRRRPSPWLGGLFGLGPL